MAWRRGTTWSRVSSSSESRNRKQSRLKPRTDDTAAVAAQLVAHEGGLEREQETYRCDCQDSRS